MFFFKIYMQTKDLNVVELINCFGPMYTDRQTN